MAWEDGWKEQSIEETDYIYGICVHCSRPIKETDLECWDEHICIEYMELGNKEW